MFRRTLVGGVAALLLAALTTAPHATATSPATAAAPSAATTTDPTPAYAARPGGRPSRVTAVRVPALHMGATSTRAGCAAQAARARAAKVTATSLCVGVEPVSSAAPLSASQRRAVAAAVSLPECSQTSTPNTGWWAASRRAACSHQQFGITVTQVPSGAIVGTANMHAVLDMTASSSSAAWTSTIYLWVWSATGIGFPEYASGNLFGCSGCTGTSSFSPAGSGSWRGAGSFSKTLTAGSIQPGLGGFWETRIGSSKWSNGSVVVSLYLASYRCDNAIGNRSPGCVLPNIPGVAAFSQSLNPDFVWHVYNAQLSGLPGRLTTGTYLKKLSNATLVARNGSTACPSSLRRPTGYQCDEYPFRSTYQGASTGGGVARSQSWCQMPDPARTGSTGWSRCFIPSGQNLSAGGLLGAFYGNERILDGDLFQVGYLS